MILRKLSAIIFLSLFLPVSMSGQSDSLVCINGKIIDSERHTPVPYANIASYSEHTMYAADSSGNFYIRLPLHDSIKIVVLGYESRIFKTDSIIYSNDIILFPLNRISIMLKNIDINLRRGYFSTGRSSADDHEFNVENLNLPSDIILYDKSKDIIPASYKPIFKHKPPLAAFFFHPVSYIHYFASKKERSKRKMVSIIYSEKKKTNFSKEDIKSISGFNGDELQEFTIYCNKNIKVEKHDNENSIKQKIFFALENYIETKDSIK